eukprot:352652-Chlamydomonas_euryale.AAC.8
MQSACMQGIPIPPPLSCSSLPPPLSCSSLPPLGCTNTALRLALACTNTAPCITCMHACIRECMSSGNLCNCMLTNEYQRAGRIAVGQLPAPFAATSHGAAYSSSRFSQPQAAVAARAPPQLCQRTGGPDATLFRRSRSRRRSPSAERLGRRRVAAAAGLKIGANSCGHRPARRLRRGRPGACVALAGRSGRSPCAFCTRCGCITRPPRRTPYNGRCSMHRERRASPFLQRTASWPRGCVT